MKPKTTLAKGVLIIIIFIIIILLLLRVYISEYLLLLEMVALSGLFFITAYEATKKDLRQHAKTNISIGLFFLFLAVVMLLILFIS